MIIGSDNGTLAKRLRAACTTRPNSIKLPRSITFTVRDTTVQMSLAASCVEANMQDNSSSFEGWALALKRWLPDIEQVELAWTSGGSERDPHYQRFLFRVSQFASIFPSWFVIAPQNRDELHKLRTNGAGPYIVTSPKKERNTPQRDECDCIDQALRTEHVLECFIKDHPEQLSELLGLANLDRQYPVGVFDGPVKCDNEIFPRGHSAIDLWGVHEAEFVLFELKTSGNIPVGILSELFFYSYIIEGLQQRRFELQEPDERIASTLAVRAYILAPEWHPLIDEGLLRLANDGFRASGRRIRFGAVRIVPDGPQAYKLELPPCD